MASIDLSQIPFPGVVESLSFETILAAMLADLQARDSAFTALVESDPAYKILEVAAYREFLIRQRVNDAAKACMLAYATGSDLENLGGLFGVTRLVLDPGNPSAIPPVPPTYESDDALRSRIQLSLEGLSTAGPADAYRFHALSVSGVKDVSVTSPSPGQVLVSVLSATGDGTASPALVAAVEAALSAQDVRPLTDQVEVQGATITPFTVEAELYLYAGPDQEVVRQDAIAAVNAYVTANHRPGRDIVLSGLYAALHRAGVQRAII
ncbi:MAG: hypothetical protein RLZZ127_1387, partial [Planctomycetota bacterium]